ncbi:hypothetical protein [Streptomyces hiroshimensis]|uniref:Uncharacterized protein n=1 Tax=Streptomyces hiroshimensis TaxID=66424 RepID=A0ABQ2YVK4_9ACTN|nr:hypothetical protein [Streptomyces hiroshimensis]GGX93600.1 hypothetical protein GCM10010324_44490 [Streptomyces hiroshimensis]
MPISLDVPTLVVDTSDGYHPGIADIVSFAQEPAMAQHRREQGTAADTVAGRLREK